MTIRAPYCILDNRIFFSLLIAVLAFRTDLLAKSPDRTPPVTSLELRGPVFETFNKTYITSKTEISLWANDPASETHSPAGVARTFFRVNNGDFSSFQDSFSLPPGFHHVEYYSQDNAGNKEPLQATDLFVDNEAPAVSVKYRGDYRELPDRIRLTPETWIDLSAEDVWYGENSFSDTESLLCRIEDEPFEDCREPFWFYVGNYVLDIQAFDRLGNATPIRSIRYEVVDDLLQRPQASADSLDSSVEPRWGASLAAPGAFRPAGEDDFRLGEIYVFPNPAADGRNPTLHVEVGWADQISLRFYDSAGHRIHQAELTGNPRFISNGHGSGYAYEYEWDVHSIPSGAYFCHVRAEKANHSPVTETLNIAVIK